MAGASSQFHIATADLRVGEWRCLQLDATECASKTFNQYTTLTLHCAASTAVAAHRCSDQTVRCWPVVQPRILANGIEFVRHTHCEFNHPTGSDLTAQTVGLLKNIDSSAAELKNALESSLALTPLKRAAAPAACATM